MKRHEHRQLVRLTKRQVEIARALRATRHMAKVLDAALRKMRDKHASLFLPVNPGPFTKMPPLNNFATTTASAPSPKASPTIDGVRFTFYRPTWYIIQSNLYP